MRFAIPGLLGLFLVACGPKFDSPDELRSLRVLAVQKDVPYAQPGQTVNLQMLWEDASIDVLDGALTRKVQVTWSSPCFDPEGDLYYGCFTDPTLFSGGFGTGNTTKFVMPKDIISRRPPPSQALNSPYGIAFVFFAVCAGTLTPIKADADTAFPIGCKDDQGNLLGSDDFVAGYTSIYSFDDFSNNNPVISGFTFNGKPLTPDQFCQDDACLAVAGSAVPPTVSCDPSTDPLYAYVCRRRRYIVSGLLGQTNARTSRQPRARLRVGEVGRARRHRADVDRLLHRRWQLQIPRAALERRHARVGTTATTPSSTRRKQLAPRASGRSCTTTAAAHLGPASPSTCSSALRALEWLSRSPSRPMHPGWRRCSSVTKLRMRPRRASPSGAGESAVTLTLSLGASTAIIDRLSHSRGP